MHYDFVFLSEPDKPLTHLNQLPVCLGFSIEGGKGEA